MVCLPRLIPNTHSMGDLPKTKYKLDSEHCQKYRTPCKDQNHDSFDTDLKN